MGNSGSASKLPYEVGERVCGLGRGATGGWSLHDGWHKKTGERVSVLRWERGGNSTQSRALGENFLRRMKTLRHPHLLAYRDGFESDLEVFVVTDAVLPLGMWLKEMRKERGMTEEKMRASIGWGFHCVLQGLGFLNEDCKLVHGSISLESILVTRGGDWKIGGFFVVGELNSSGPCSLFRETPDILASKYKPPERLANKWNFMNIEAGGLTALDVWSLGCVLFECFAGEKNDSSEFENLRGIPSQLQKVFNLMLANAPSERPGCKKLYRHPGFKFLFRSKLFSMLSFLEEYQLKTDAERAPFIHELSERMDEIPRSICCFKVLPVLKAAFRYTSVEIVSNGAQSQKTRLSPLSPSLLGPFLGIGSMLEDQRDYAYFVIPSVVELFKSSDRSIRVGLLQQMTSFIEHMDDEIINEELFSLICTGYKDSAPLIRELTIKSAVQLAPKLSPKNLNEILLRYLIQLLKDVEPALRTNTLIALSKILDSFDDSTRMKVILNSFPQALRDPFVPARVSAVRGLASAGKYLESEPASIAGKILPALSIALIDPSPEVRSQAFKIMEKSIADLKIYSEKKAIEQQREEQEAEKREREARQSEELSSTTTTTASTSNGEAAASGYLSQAAGWAATSFSRNWGSQQQQQQQQQQERQISASAPLQLREPSAGLSLSSATPSDNNFGDVEGDSDDDDDDEGWNVHDDDEDLFGESEKGSANRKPQNEIPGEGLKLQTKNSSSSLNAFEGQEDFFGEILNSSPAKTAGLSKAFLSSNSDAEKKRQQARQRATHRREKIQVKKVAIRKAPSGSNKKKEDDDWDDW